MTIVDRCSNLSWAGFNLFSKSEVSSPLANGLTDQLPTSNPSLGQCGLTTGDSPVATDMMSARRKAEVVAVGLLCMIGISSIPRLIVGITSPLFAGMTILAYIVYNIGQFFGGKVSLQSLLNLLGLAMNTPRTISPRATSEKEKVQIEEVIEEQKKDSKTVTETPTESQTTSQSPTEKKLSFENFKEFEKKEDMVEEFKQFEAHSTTKDLVENFKKFEEKEAMIEEFKQFEAHSTTKDLVENFKKFEEKEAMIEEFKQFEAEKKSQNNDTPVPTEKTWSDQYIQTESNPVKGSDWVNEFAGVKTTPQISDVVEQFEQFNAVKDLTDEFVQSEASLNSNPAMRRIQVILSQTKSQEKTEKVKEQKTAEKQRTSKEHVMKCLLQIEQQRQAMRGKAKL